jgi:hypothetical protein
VRAVHPITNFSCAAMLADAFVRDADEEPDLAQVHQTIRSRKRRRRAREGWSYGENLWP